MTSKLCTVYVSKNIYNLIFTLKHDLYLFVLFNISNLTGYSQKSSKKDPPLLLLSEHNNAYLKKL